MTRPSSSSLGLLLLLVAVAAAGPPSACQEHARLHSRLDSVEKKVEDAVGALEVELASLLEAVEAPEWRPLLDRPGAGRADVVLEEPRGAVRSPREEGLMSA